MISSIGYNIWKKTIPVKVKVPKFTGLTVEAATEIAKELGIFINVAGNDFSDDYESGLIMLQNYEEGATVFKKDSIMVTVSDGTDKIEVPSVINETTQDAYEILSESFEVHEETEYSDDIAMGLVIRQTPEAGTMEKPGSKVDLVISLGKEVKKVTVPKVEGLTESVGKTLLMENGLQVGDISRRDSSTVGEGIIISQTISPGNVVREGSSVSIQVSRGAPKEAPPPTKTPDPAERTKVINLVPAYIPPDMDELKIRVTKYYMEDGVEKTERVIEADVAIDKFPYAVAVTGKGKARIQFSIFYNGDYQLQADDPIDFTEGGN